jgi:hypothetical protein
VEPPCNYRLQLAELYGVVLFLMKKRFVTGITLTVDGGGILT